MKVEKLTVADLEVKQFYEKQDKDKSDTYVIIPFLPFILYLLPFTIRARVTTLGWGEVCSDALHYH